MKEKVHLEELFEIGSSKRVFQSEWRDSGIPFYRAREIARLAADGYVDNELFIDEELYHEYIERYGKPKPGDIMVTGVGTLGVCYIVKDNDEFYFKDGNILWFRQKAQNKVISEYVVKAFNSRAIKEQIQKNSSGTTVGTFTIQTAKKVELELPNMEEQHKIISILGRLEKIIGKRKEQLDSLDNLIKSRFVEMFGDLAVNPFNWIESYLIDLCSNKDDIKCGPFGTQLSKDEYQKEGVPLWGIPQINSSFTIMPTDYLSEEKAEKLEAYSIIKGDIVMSRKGNVGKCAIYSDELPVGIMHSDALRIRINPEIINSKFLMHQLHNSRYVVNQIENVSSGAIMAGVNVTKLKTIFVHIPPIVLQNEFATFVQQVDKLKFTIQRELDETQQLFDALMQQYFG